MSFVFYMNIVLGNVSMRYIPVSFMQTIKSFRPIILQCLVWSKHFEWRIWASLVPIVRGILLTSMTELSFNIFGFCATMIGFLATSTKTILAESLLHGYKFDSINTVYYMAPFATMILALPAMLLEGGGVIDWFYTHDVFSSLIIILGSGVLAFCLNFSIFYVIHSTIAVTFNVAGNLKVRPSWTIYVFFP
uniref:Sugar phosphate transporter domain-containing protein n=1 Tax=Hordeum vulgare subsp. vulgare TaxID=112509 RepID=A0A8I6X0V5_HORVV